jgi:hypothetical protein
MNKKITKIIQQLPFIKGEFFTSDEVEELKKELKLYQLGWPPGHFYSPIPALDEVKKREDKIWAPLYKTIPGIETGEEEQIILFNQLIALYKMQPWKEEKQEHFRYYFNNPNFSYGESILLFCLLLHLKPQKVIEIGSGFSSCVLLDVNELFFNNVISHTFIEPYPQLLSSLLKPSDNQNIKIITKNLQEVPADAFSELSSGDILLIDSTHVSKVDSDVNHILFNILPQLNSGVFIHFHDIYYPFEYPKEWVYQGRAWNEAYLLKAFLQYNYQFEIVLFNSFIGHFYKNLLEDKMPLCALNPGSSLWIRKK